MSPIFFLFFVFFLFCFVFFNLDGLLKRLGYWIEKFRWATWGFFFVGSVHLMTQVFFFYWTPAVVLLPPYAAALMGLWVAVGTETRRPVRAADPSDGERPLETASPWTDDAFCIPVASVCQW
jgi:hypothetical protein